MKTSKWIVATTLVMVSALAVIKRGETFFESPSDVHLVSANANDDAPARFALAAAFLSAVAGRFGLWTGQLQWEAFDRFVARTAELNQWAPLAMVPVLAWSATIAETTFAIALIAGARWAAFGSAALLAWFALAMLVYTGPKPPLDYSVFSASACALLLALHETRAARSIER